MTMGDLLAFLVALVDMTQPLRSLVGAAGPMQQGIAAGQSIFELLDEPTEPTGGIWSSSACAARSNSRMCRSPISRQGRRSCTTSA